LKCSSHIKLNIHKHINMHLCFEKKIFLTTMNFFFNLVDFEHVLDLNLSAQQLIGTGVYLNIQIELSVESTRCSKRGYLLLKMKRIKQTGIIQMIASSFLNSLRPKILTRYFLNFQFVYYHFI
jgi:hypothetical protein